MQFHLNGFRTGDPSRAARAASASGGTPGRDGALPGRADLLIVGCGPAGLTLAAQLAAFPDIATCIVDARTGPLELGQADGVACRTMEMFNAFGFAERVLREACWVNETSFWRSADDPAEGIVRGGWVRDTEEGLSEFPHVILNQARVHQFYLDVMRDAPAGLEPHYGRRLVDLAVDTQGGDDHPVIARFEWTGPDGSVRTETMRARYVVGCDGARSTVRASLGLTLKGDSANQAWGVMDVLAATDFPDIRFKSVINSPAGSIVLIPREGGYLVRIYVEVDKLGEGERVAARNMHVDDIIAAANRVLHPYRLDVKEVAWWSVYEIGQRLCDHFDDGAPGREPHVFIAGDACHTHSPKAGQGMNVSMQDAFNLGWKLAAVLRGRAAPALLRSYSAERQAIAKELIDFDRAWAAMLSAPSKGSGGGADPADVRDYFVRHGHYTAGTATRYAPSLLTGTDRDQSLARGFEIGKRFHSAPVVRCADARPMHLGHVVEADGRWRLFIFAPDADPAMSVARIGPLCDWLGGAADSPLVRYTPAGLDVDAVIDVRAVFQQPHRALQAVALPPLLQPAKGRYGLRDHEKCFSADAGGGIDIFDLRGINRQRGCMVIVRPDQYVGHVLPLDGTGALAAYFDGFMIRAETPGEGDAQRHPAMAEQA